jgi:hypothetical protein
MLDGVVLLWFVLAALGVAFVAIDIRNTPESPVLKWGFVLLTAYTGVVGAFLYVLGCREPLPEMHEQYTAARWRQTLGSTMHCVAGDGVGILVGAVLSSLLGLVGLAEVALEYLLGFGFGWTIFQALFHAGRRGGLLPPCAEAHIYPGASVDESSDGRDGPDRREPPAASGSGQRSGARAILVRHVDGIARRLYRRLSDESVARRQPS